MYVCAKVLYSCLHPCVCTCVYDPLLCVYVIELSSHVKTSSTVCELLMLQSVVPQHCVCVCAICTALVNVCGPIFAWLAALKTSLLMVGGGQKEMGEKKKRGKRRTGLSVWKVFQESQKGK